MTTPDPFNRSKQELQESVSILKENIAAMERELLPLEVQYRQVLKETVLSQVKLEKSQTQGAENFVQAASQKIQELRQQAVQLKIQIKEGERKLTPLRETLKAATAQLNSM
uniref:Uncharacterized protein n=1 Tax=Oscillatoriales cyanobacterium SpSt-418 TaxID=2282169 RepID=A0A7C3KJ12_9CYAN